MSAKREKRYLGDAQTHLVGIGALRVLIAKDGPSFVAQGLEIDYVAQGNSIQEVQTNFEDGLAATIAEHLKVYGGIQRVLKMAPADLWAEYFSLVSSDAKFKFYQVKTYKLPEAAASIDFYVEERQERWPATECGKLVDCGPVGWLPCDWPIGHPMRCAPSEDSTRKAVAAMPDPICGCVCCCGPNLEPLACGYKRGHDGAHAWGTLPTFPAKAAHTKTRGAH